MKKIFGIFIFIQTLLMLIIPSFALGSPTTDGAYNSLPPTSIRDAYGGSYSIMRAYASVNTVFVGNATQNGNVSVNGTKQSYYPTIMASTPDSIVSASPIGFGLIEDYSSTIGWYTNLQLKSLYNSTGFFSGPPYVNPPELVTDGIRGNSILYSIALEDAQTNTAIQYGIVSGEWINTTNTDSIVTGYSIKWSADEEMTVSLTGSIIYGYEGNVIGTVDIDRNYIVAAGDVFQFNPQNLLQYEDTINYDYYVFTGNWTCHSSAAGHLVEYKAYDFVNTETVDYLGGYNEYVDQSYSIDLYPIARITSKLTSSNSPGAGTLAVDIDDNGSYTYDVSDYSQVNIDVNVPQEVVELRGGIFKWLFDSVQGFLTMEIAPDFSLGGLLLFAVGFALIMWIVKIFLGG